MASGSRPCSAASCFETGSDDFTEIADDDDDDETQNGEAEFLIENTHISSVDDLQFDNAVNVLSVVVMSDAFQNLLSSFYREHCHHFETAEENKLIYTDVFKHYSERIEGFLEESLCDAIDGFSMAAFIEHVRSREDEIDLPIFDLLVSFSDFEAFKQQMLAEKSSNAGENSFSELYLCGTPLHVHKDEMEDGEERPDLEDILLVMPTSPSGQR